MLSTLAMSIVTHAGCRENCNTKRNGLAPQPHSLVADPPTQPPTMYSSTATTLAAAAVAAVNTCSR